MQGFIVTLIFLLLAPRVSAATVMAVSFDAEEMRVVKETLAKDLNKHRMVDVVIRKDSDYSEFVAAIRQNKPDFIALLDNKAVNFMKKLEELKEPEFARIQAAATMALNLRQVLQSSKRISGIAYEVPAFTTITKFRSLISRPIVRVLAPYRSSEFSSMMTEARLQLQKEGIELVGVDVEVEGREVSAINKVVEKMLTEASDGKKFDAILVPSDNIILNKEAFRTIWLPKARSVKLPFLCNIEKFVSKDFDFCTFAAYPDLVPLGHQLAEQISEALDNGTAVADLGVDYLIGVQLSLNLQRARTIELPLKATEVDSVKQVQ